MKDIDIYSRDDMGYIGDNQRWWFDENHPDCFSIFNLDSFYPDKYFADDHSMSDKDIHNYCYEISRIYKLLTNKNLQSIFEAGCGGGWFTKEFYSKGVDILGIEGSNAGYEFCLKRGIPNSCVIRYDLRKPLPYLGKKFDISICTEVAEHIEIPFSSQLIQTITTYSDLVWFSFEAAASNSAHYHHCNEQPDKFWINLFDFFGYKPISIPPEIGKSLAFRGTHIFYNKYVYSDLEKINLKHEN